MVENIQISSSTFVPELLKNEDWKFENFYTIFGEPLGKGAFGEAWKCKDERIEYADLEEEVDSVRVVKILDFSLKAHEKSIVEQELVKLKNEVNILKSLDHPSILKIHDFFADEENYKYYVVTECIYGKPLSQLIKDHIVDDGHKFIPFNDNDLKEFFRALLKAVNYCHHLEPDMIVHRDLKPDNIMF